jgi:UDP-N-acetylmuramoyl-L-alanyl-D-glutamate--2,6-diaminopimelate ligase
LKLNQLIQGIPTHRVSGNLDIEIGSLTHDSRQVEAGALFFCIKGTQVDGHLYLKQAAGKGAVAAIVQDWPDETYNLTIVQVSDVAKIVKDIAGAFYDYPERKLQLIGVVGTNGKTTTTYLIKSILEAAGKKVGLIGTITNLIDDQPLASHNTTPGTLELQQIFARMVRAGIEYVVMEVSSHSIAQGRVAGLNFRVGVFTNITQDHLDYHKTFEEYFRVKSKFFADLDPNAWAIINNDDDHAEQLIDRTTGRVITYGVEQVSDIQADKIEMAIHGSKYTAVTPHGSIDVNLKLTSYCNVYNSLGALAVGLSLGMSPAAIKHGLEAVTGVPGRFQPVPEAKDFDVFVDYAHTPDGLENVLKTGRKLGAKRLVVVFGCGGDRDRTKRPIMGAIAAKLADFTILTSDNPRSEEPIRIIQEIETGFTGANPNAKYLIEADRAKAIQKVIELAEPGDQIWIVGKGHEDYQEFSGHRIHFDDREVARAALLERYSERYSEG